MRCLILSAVVLPLAGCCCCCPPTPSGSQSDPSIGQYSATETKTETPAAPLPTINFDDIIRTRSDLFGGENLTDIQRDDRWKAHVQSLTRHRADAWTGFVLDAKESAFGDKPHLVIDMATHEDGEGDVYLYVNERQAASVNIGTKVIFSGNLRGLWPEIGRPYAVEVDATELRAE